MKKRGSGYFFALAAILLLVGLACSSLSSTASAPTSGAAVADTPATSSGSPDAGGTTTFTDQNKYFAIDIPSGWKHTQDADSKNNYWYQDTFKSPDGHARVDSIVYNDGTPWTGSQNGAFALQLLNQYYSNTGKEGDIRVSGDTIQKDGSERLDWTSKSGGYSGESFFEVRNRMTFLMLSILWDNDFSTQYEKPLDDVVSSYTIP